MLTCFWVEPYILFKYAFLQPVSRYFINYAGNALLTILVGGCTWWLCTLLPGGGMWIFAAKVLVCAVVPNVLFYIVFHRTEELAFFKEFLQARIKK